MISQLDYEYTPIPSYDDIKHRLVNELWGNIPDTQKLAMIKEDDLKCTLNAYKSTIDFMKEEMTGLDHDEILTALTTNGIEEAFKTLRSIYKEKRSDRLPVAKEVAYRKKLYSFLKSGFHEYMGYDKTIHKTYNQFFELMEEAESRLAQEMKLTSPDAAGNLVMLSQERLKPDEVVYIVEKLMPHGFINTLAEIELRTKNRKYKWATAKDHNPESLH